MLIVTYIWQRANKQQNKTKAKKYVVLFFNTKVFKTHFSPMFHENVKKKLGLKWVKKAHTKEIAVSFSV